MASELKVAIVQDWFTVNGGAEKVVRQLFQIYPQADAFSLIDCLNDADRDFILNGKKSNTSVIQKFPFSKHLYRYYLPWMAYAIEQLDLRSYDLVVSSSYAVAKGVLTHKDQLHICYCHSPMRYIWDLYLDYVPEVKWYNFPYAILMRKILAKMRVWDVVSANRVDYFIANSKNVSDRIQKTYRRESEVIYPPVDLNDSRVVEDKQDYFITASRLVPYKRVDLIVEAFQSMPDKKLVVCGSGPELKRIKRMASKSENIEVKGHLPRNTYIEMLGGAQAFINASHEDFGLSPVEAQACGTAVIGYAKGGLLESTKAGETAVYFESQTAESIKKAVESFDLTKLAKPTAIGNFARQFSSDIFKKEIKAFIDKCQH